MAENGELNESIRTRIIRNKGDLMAEHADNYLKAGFHMIANDRRRSRVADRRSQTIAKRPVSI